MNSFSFAFIASYEFFWGVWPVKGRKKAAGAEQDWAHWQHGSPLVDPVQIASRHVGHANGPRRAVHEFISIPA